MKSIPRDYLHEEWLAEKQRLKKQLSIWSLILIIALYPGTLLDYSQVAPEETHLFVWIRLLPSVVGIIIWLVFHLLRQPIQRAMYLVIMVMLICSTYRTTNDMGNFVFINATCLILMSAIPLIAFWQSIMLFLYLIVVNVSVYLVIYADKIPLPQSGLMFTATLGIMFVLVSRFRHEVIRRNFIQSFQLRNQNRQIVDQKEELKVLNRHLHEKNERLFDSLTYAQSIQKLLLPHPRDIQRIFPESFVFFKPRNQVSGDFYWLTEIPSSGNGQSKPEVILVAMDCTGHGVPGALISMIGESLLRQVIDKEQVYSPNKILDRLHKEIRHTLRQKESCNRDGMDMGVMRINFAQKSLQYAGARNTLIYFQQDKIQIVRGDLYSIGGEQREMKRTFTSHKIALDTTTTFYLFSDGFQDQFGGSEGKKFMRQQFRETLQSIHQLPLDAQKTRLEQILAQWQSNHEQVDDILVMGVRLSL